MIKNYDEYKKNRKNIIEKMDDAKKIGKKYNTTYLSILPTNIKQYALALKDNSFLKEINNYTTTLEYLGDGIYKDLTTEQLITNDSSEDLDVCSKYPFFWIEKYFKEEYETFDDVEYPSKEEEYIKEMINKKRYELLNSLYDDLLDMNDFSNKDREKITYLKEELEEEEIGKKYAVRYSDLGVVMDLNIYSSYMYDYFRDGVYTIVEYIGDNKYKDLTTGFIFQDMKTSILLLKDNNRVDYTKYNKDEFEKAIEYPIRISRDILMVINDNILLSINDKTIDNSSDICDKLGYINEEFIKKIRQELEIIIKSEYSKQYRNALDEYERYINNKSLEEKINRVEKIYKLK